jgi:hypothetical protein
MRVLLKAAATIPDKCGFSSSEIYGPCVKAVEGCARRTVATVPVDLAFALLKSARVSTAGAIRARYQGSTRRVLFKATSSTFYRMLAQYE